MFVDFFYRLKEVGVPVSPTALLTLEKAMGMGLVNSLDEFYTAARSILVKSERYFDLYDQVFAFHFKGVEMPDEEGLQLDAIARAMLEEWLKDPKNLEGVLDLDREKMSNLSPEELIEYFKERLKDQKGRHEGGNRWIGTGGRSPVGNSGHHPGGMRIGGGSRNRSAVKVAGERRYRDYSGSGLLTPSMMGEALKRLRNMVPAGPKDQVNVDETIYRTMRNGGEIEIVFDRCLKDRLKVILAIDNGGWSMDPYIAMVQTLFDYAGSQFKEVKTYFFHNTIYGHIWEDPTRYRKPFRLDDFSRFDPDTRLIVVGDASMAPYELMARDGSIHVEERCPKTSIQCLTQLTETFPHAVWLNPVQERLWGYTHTIQLIKGIFPMYELTLDGLEKAVTKLMAK